MGYILKKVHSTQQIEQYHDNFVNPIVQINSLRNFDEPYKVYNPPISISITIYPVRYNNSFIYGYYNANGSNRGIFQLNTITGEFKFHTNIQEAPSFFFDGEFIWSEPAHNYNAHLYKLLEKDFTIQYSVNNNNKKEFTCACIHNGKTYSFCSAEPPIIPHGRITIRNHKQNNIIQEIFDNNIKTPGYFNGFKLGNEFFIASAHHTPNHSRITKINLDTLQSENLIYVSNIYMDNLIYDGKYFWTYMYSYQTSSSTIKKYKYENNNFIEILHIPSNIAFHNFYFDGKYIYHRESSNSIKKIDVKNNNVSIINLPFDFYNDLIVSDGNYLYLAIKESNLYKIAKYKI